MVIEGSALDDWVGSVEIDDIRLFYYDGTNFVAIPFQIDQRRITHINYNVGPNPPGSDPEDPQDPGYLVSNCELGYWPELYQGPNGEPKTGFGDTTLQQYDEIVFLIRDALPGSAQASTSTWHSNAEPTRYELVLNDPRASGAKRYIYAFRWDQYTPPALSSVDYITRTADPIMACPPVPEACSDVTSVTLMDVNTLDTHFSGNWIIDSFRVRAAGDGTDPPLLELLDRFQYTAEPNENEDDWSGGGRPRFLGDIDGPVRIVRGVQGALSGRRTTKYEFIYPTMLQTRVNLRVHDISFITRAVDHDVGVRNDSNSDFEGYAWHETRFGTDNAHTDIIDGSCITGDCHPTGFAYNDWSEVATEKRGGYSEVFQEAPLHPMPVLNENRATTYADSHVMNPDMAVYGESGRVWSSIACTEDGSTDGPAGNEDGCAHPEDPGLFFARFDAYMFPRRVLPDPANKDSLAADEFEPNVLLPVTATAVPQSQSVGDPPPCNPLVPTLTASDPQTGAVDLNVNHGAGGCQNARLFRALPAGQYELIADLGTSTTHTDYSTQPGVTARYVATSYNEKNTESGYSSEASLTPTDTTAPRIPTGVTATAGDSSASLEVSGLCTRDIDGLNVYLATTSGGPYQKVNSSPVPIRGPTAQWQQSGLQNGQPYYWVVTAIDRSGNESGYSTEVTATPGS